ncbi:MAG: hypothetical protein Kow0081_1120 [Candidatus Dojkabacteria bacterium]
MDLQAVADSLGFDARLALFSTINFLVVFVLLYIFLFKRIGKFLNERQNKINESLENAKKLENAIEIAEQEKAKIIKMASNKANEILNKSKEDAEKTASAIKAAAIADAEKMQSDAKMRIDAERSDMIKDLKTRTAELAILATQKILDAELDEERDKEIINEYLDKLDNQ